MKKYLPHLSLFIGLFLGFIAFASAQCLPQSAPYTENMGFSTSYFPDCWTAVTSSSANYPKISSDPSGTPFNCCMAFNNNNLLAMPEMAPDMNSLRVSFNALTNNVNVGLVVGVMSDVSSASSFVPVDTVFLASANTFVPIEVHFNAYTGSGQYIAFKFSGSSFFYIDDVTVDLIPNCLNPVGLSVSNVLAQSAAIAWTEPGTATQWNAILSTTPVTNFSSQTPMVLNAPSYNPSNLTPNTTYYFYVQSVCGGENSEWASATFTTLCGSSLLPLTESFGNALPACWAIQQVNGNVNLNFVGYGMNPNVTAFSGSGMVLWASRNYTSGQQVRLVSQAVSSIGADALDVNFMWHHDDGIPQAVNEGVQIQYSFDGNTWTNTQQNLIPRYSTAYAGWTEYDVLIPEAGEHSQVYVGFLFTSDGGNNCYMDEVNIRAASGCFAPANVAVSNVSGNTATLTWTEVGTASQWQVVISETPLSSFSGVNPVTVSAPTHMFTNLNPTTTYYAYVRSVCSGNTTGSWSHAVCFTTGCGSILSLPYHEGFDDYGTCSNAFPPCWSRPLVSQYFDEDTQITCNTPSATDFTASDGSNSLRFCTPSSGYTYAISPAIHEDIHHVSVSFFLYKTSAQYAGTLTVGVMSDASDFASFEPVATFEPTQVNTWSFFSVDFANTTASGADNRIAFRHDGVSDYDYLLLDEVDIVYTPDCWPAHHMEVSNVTGNSATFDWLDVNDPEIQWNMKISETPLTDADDFANVADTTFSGHHFTINYLNGGTTYYYYLSPACGGNNSGTWLSGELTTLPCNCYVKVYQTSLSSNGWYGAAIQLRQGGSVIATVTMLEGQYDTVTVYTCNAGNIDFWYVSGGIDMDVAFRIDNSGGMTLYTSNGTPTAGCFLSNSPGCGVSCSAAPSNVNAVNIPDGARITWNTAPEAQSYNVYRNGNRIASYITGTQYIDDNVLSGENCYTITASCIVGESDPSQPSCIVGVEEYENTQHVSIFPNPARDKFTVKADFHFDRIVVTNMFGQEVYAVEINSDHAELQSDMLPAGLYMVSVRSLHTQATQKLVISR
ncbi:MAG: fibronectin type III domain-containing protein [Bacteroidales bacterium]|nr:fibronectin type III domain-containing protein [Bacteroidales bacterium]